MGNVPNLLMKAVMLVVTGAFEEIYKKKKLKKVTVRLPSLALNVSTQINPANQTPGHTRAGGIFTYQNNIEGTQMENISQNNIQDVLSTVPEEKQSSQQEMKIPTISSKSILSGIR